MIIRNILPSDHAIIKRLNDAQDFKLKHLGNNIIDRIVYDNDNPVAYGIVKRHGEAIILTNPESNRITRVKALTELMKVAEYGASTNGCEQLHCFTDDIRLANALNKHFGFIRTNSIVMVKNL